MPEFLIEQKISLNVYLLFFNISYFNIALNNFSCMVRTGFDQFRLFFVSIDEQLFLFLILTGFIVSVEDPRGGCGVCNPPPAIFKNDFDEHNYP